MSFGVYIHIPYCVKKCPYCDFNSYGVGKRIPEREYTEAILKEINLYRELIGAFPLGSIFFGGGTPSLFSPNSIGKIMGEILTMASPLDSIEVSLEVNPKTADLENLRGLRDAGVNRISVGVQSFSERKLKLLGRINTPDDSRKILYDIIKAGYKNFNLDLMFGVSFETIDEWRADLEEALGFNTTHISAYCLTIEDDTEFGTLYSGVNCRSLMRTPLRTCSLSHLVFLRMLATDNMKFQILQSRDSSASITSSTGEERII